MATRCCAGKHAETAPGGDRLSPQIFGQLSGRAAHRIVEIEEAQETRVLKVLHVTEHIQGGIATYLDSLFTEQVRTDEWADCRLVMARHEAASLSDEYPYPRILYDYPGRGLSGFIALDRAVRFAVQEFTPDVVHLHSSFPGLTGRLPGVIRSIWGRRPPAIVYTSHGWSFLMEKSWVERQLYAQIERLLAFNCDRIICISQNEFRAAIGVGIPKRKCRLVLNGLPASAAPAETVSLPPEVLAAKTRGELIFLFVGRYHHTKGIDLLTDAFRLFSGEPKWLLAAGGDFLEEGISFPEHARSLGWVSPGQVTFLLEFCDALVVPSRWEGFGLVAAEAARAGKPVICSNRGGLPEVVQDGVTGIVFNNLSALGIADALSKLTRSSLQQMGAAGRTRFQQLFTASRMAEQTFAVYREAIEARVARGGSIQQTPLR